MERRNAFTLAEVLITLTILGVVAAITVPSLIQKQSDRATVTKVKKAYATFNNAFDIAIAENGPLANWDVPEKTSAASTPNGVYVGNIVTEYIKTREICKYRNNKCSTKSYDWYDLNNNRQGSRSYDNSIITADGIQAWWGSYKYHSDGSVHIDVNTIKNGPNRLGYDQFLFRYYGNKREFYLIPGSMGASSGYCSTTKPSSGWTNGYSCAFWIIKHGNTDYKYRDVSKEW